jgi:hypothetical protein
MQPTRMIACMSNTSSIISLSKWIPIQSMDGIEDAAMKETITICFLYVLWIDGHELSWSYLKARYATNKNDSLYE